jgi:hypothetical protein
MNKAAGLPLASTPDSGTRNILSMHLAMFFRLSSNGRVPLAACKKNPRVWKKADGVNEQRL